MDILSSVLVTISCEIHKKVFIRVAEMNFFILFFFNDPSPYFTLKSHC